LVKVIAALLGSQVGGVVGAAVAVAGGVGKAQASAAKTRVVITKIGVRYLFFIESIKRLDGAVKEVSNVLNKNGLLC
jgi:hypothetical protein